MTKVSKVKEYASLRASTWGSGEFGEKELGRPDPFTVLADETRLAITVLLCLKGPLTAKQIADELELSSSTILDHLRKLKDALLIKEVDVPEKKYKQERYYDIDLVPYFMDEREEMARRIDKYLDILKQTTITVFEKCLDELADYKNTLMAKHGITLERDDVKHLVWAIIWNSLADALEAKAIYVTPLRTVKRHFFFMGLERRRIEHTQ